MDRFETLTNYLINWVVVIIFNKCKASPLSCVFVCDYVDIDDIAEVPKVISQLRFFNIVAKTS